ncbi:hypothetical protein BC940DRAFT_301760 [Gongronella butleri]|nr:hypothetical protein BC940DRAFT_301760 [Gongronella butleri]
MLPNSRIVPPPGDTTAPTTFAHHASLKKPAGQQQQQPYLSRTLPSKPTTRSTAPLTTLPTTLHTSNSLPFEPTYKTGALTADDAKKKSGSQRKGIGKFFKKLGKTFDDEDEAPQVRAVTNVLSVKSSRSYNHIPLAPPPPAPAPPAKSPDALLASLPQEYKSRSLRYHPLPSTPASSAAASSAAAASAPASASTKTKEAQNGPLPTTLPVSRPQNTTLAPTPSILARRATTNGMARVPTPGGASGASSSSSSSSAASTPTPPRSHSPPIRQPSPKPTLFDDVAPASVQHPRWSVSTRKSSASYSIYSTFGADSATSQETLDEKIDDLTWIVTNNVQRRSQARVVATPASNSSYSSLPPTQLRRASNARDLEDDSDRDDDEDDDEDDDDDDDVFVDATGLSQDDMDKERMDARLSKRLSGGHFGSAGGLLQSIATAHHHDTRRRPSYPPSPDSTHDQQQKPSLKPTIHNTNSSSTRSTNSTSSDSPAVPSSLSTKKPLPPPQPTQSLSGQKENKKDELTSFVSSQFWNEKPNLTLHGFDDPMHDDLDLTDPVVATQVHQAKIMALQLWNENAAFVTKERAAEWLGTSKPLNSLVLRFYMDHFDFSSLRLDEAFRKLCTQLYFKAEGQQIERLLEAFAKRYWHDNPRSVLGSMDVVYAVVYSLLLLNTDLHVAQGNYVRMTKQAFVRNTMSTIEDQSTVKITRAWQVNMEAHLKDMYTSVKQRQILQPHADDTDIVVNEKRGSIMGGLRMMEMKRNMGNIIRKSVLEPTVHLDDASSIVSPVKSPSSPIHGASSKRDSFSSVTSSTVFPSLPNGLFVNQSPYAKEGVVVRKHLLDQAAHKAKHRDWRECLLVVADGELKMYAVQGNHPDNTVDRKTLMRSSHMMGNAGDQQRWATFTHLTGTISLNHSLANSLPPPGYNRQRPHVFAIQQAHGGVYLFQSSSQAQVHEWVATCNYWAARLSKEPLQGGVSNMEYGWGNCLNDVILNLDDDYREKPIGIHGDVADAPNQVMIYDWTPPTPPMVGSSLDEKDQLAALQRYLAMLNADINEHRDLKKKILVKFPSKHPQHARVLANWEQKSKYLLHEIIKYQHYCNALEQSIHRAQIQGTPSPSRSIASPSSPSPSSSTN